MMLAKYLQWSSLVVLSSMVMAIGCDQPIEEEPSPDFSMPIQQPPIQPRIAEVGVGKQGQSLKDEQGIGKIISQPAMTLFATKEKVAFEVLIPQAMSFFKANNGRAPASDEEFMQKIIKEQRIKLPQLPEGQVYRYHPDDEQLWVEAEGTPTATDGS